MQQLNGFGYVNCMNIVLFDGFPVLRKVISWARNWICFPAVVYMGMYTYINIYDQLGNAGSMGSLY